MSEPLTILQEKLAEAHGLAIAATSATEKVEEVTLVEPLRRELAAMRDEARQTRARCIELADSLGEELADELRAHAVSTSERAADLAAAWFKAGTGPLGAWSFLAMGEAGELAVWTALEQLVHGVGDDRLAELVEWALPVQQRHLEAALAGAARIAELADPAAPRWG